MTTPTARLLRIILLAALLSAPATASAWWSRSGEDIPGEPVAFDYTSKEVEFDSGRKVPASELSLRSRQWLLFSRVFHQSYPTEPAFPRERIHLFILAAAVPSLALFVGFWIAGALVARKASPVRALIAFPGSWLVGAIFVLFYLFFAARFGGGAGTVAVGAVMGTVLLSVYVSAVYSCSITRGFLVFSVQIFAAAFISIVVFAVSEVVVGEEELERFWEERVFRKVGMVGTNSD